MNAPPLFLALALLGLAAVAVLGGCASTSPYMQEADFGRAEDKPVQLYTLTNKNGLCVKITNYGAIVTEIHVPDRNGKLADVVLGFSKLDDYTRSHPYFGAIVGRVANRIAGGRFTLDGKEYELARNEKARHHLHGGRRGFDRAVWTGELVATERGPTLELTHLSADGDEGYPGNLRVKVIYTLTHENEFMVRISADTDKPTPVNLTTHSYWNLAGQGRGDILQHELEIDADCYTPTGPDLIPSGEIAPVEGTPYDFRVAKTIGRDLRQIPANRDLGNPGGYDVNFVLKGKDGVLHPTARVHEPRSGRLLEMSTTEPGLQFYSGNFLDSSDRGKRGAVYGIRTGFCLEPQHFPDSIHRPEWPSIVLRPGETYQQKTVYRFSTR